ncbi:hypothetical protein KAW64_16310 [bacterium]|nr:hypothetical protein [bacterium]
MARTTGRVIVLASLLLVLVAGVMGCGPKPPCEGADVTAVQLAQDESDAALTELDTARSERAELEADVAGTRSEIANLEGQPAALEARLHELKKGSGR